MDALLLSAYKNLFQDVFGRNLDIRTPYPQKKNNHCYYSNGIQQTANVGEKKVLFLSNKYLAFTRMVKKSKK